MVPKTSERLLRGFCTVEVSKSNDTDTGTGEPLGGDTWQSGDGVLISASVTVSQNEKSSVCKVTLNDPNNEVAAKYIKMSFDEGGIVGTPEPPTASAASTAASSTLPTVGDSTDVPNAIIAECKRQGITAPHKIAFILAVAQGESGFNHKAFNPETGNPNIGGGAPKYGGRGLGQITHDYNYDKYGKELGIPLKANPELAFRPDVSTFILVAGIKRGWTGRGGLDKWFPSPTSSTSAAYQAIQGGVWRTDYTRYYQQWLQKLGSMSALSSANEPQASTAGTPKLPDTPEVSSKGRVIRVSLGFDHQRMIQSFEFIHNATDTDYRGVTTLSGQSIRWVMNRTKKNTAFKNITLGQLVDKVAKSYGMRSQTDATAASIKLEYVDQSGLTDFQLLIRECEWYGLRLSEKGKTLVVEKPKGEPSGVSLAYLGGDIDTWKIEDKAGSQLQTYNGQGLTFHPGNATSAKDEAKTAIDPKQGTMVKSQVEAVNRATGQTPVKTKATTATPPKTGSVGEPVKPPVSDPMGGTAATEARQAMRRVKGLPSTFETPTTPTLLRLQPNQAFNTVGHPSSSEVFNRAWVVDSVTHDYDLGSLKTTIAAFTPMDVKATEPATTADATAMTPDASGQPLSGEWSWPIPNATTCGAKCEFGYARGRLHAGIDLGGYGDDTTRAATSGVVTVVKKDPSGAAGRLIAIRRSDGWVHRYLHMASIAVREGQTVNRGDVIGVRGGSGFGKNEGYAIHLHFETRRPDGQAVDPRTVLPKDGAPKRFG